MESTTTAPVRAVERVNALTVAQLAPHAVYETLNTQREGLTSAEAAGRFQVFGPNQYVPRRRWQSWLGPLAVAIRPLLLPLWIAAAIAYGIGEQGIAATIAIAALLNTVAGALQERKVERAAAVLRDALPAYAHVVRDGRDYHILVSQVVPGDVLLLHSGELVAADARVVDEHDLRTINVALEGEAAPMRKVASAVMGEELHAIELPNVVYAGSRVSSGTGHAIVFATGGDTAYGKIAALTDTAHEEPSPLLWVFARLGGVVMTLALVATTLGVLYARSRFGLDQQAIWLLIVAMLVAAVPVGLMPGITLILLEGAGRLARSGAVVRRLSSVETLGATTVICADKTGTLTQNELTVRELWTIDGALRVTGVGFKPEGVFKADGKQLASATVQQRAGDLLRAAVLTSDARLLPPDTLRPHWHILGDPTEAAGIVVAAKAGYRAAQIFEATPEVLVLPQQDGLGLEGRVVDEHGAMVAYLKGSPSTVLARCTTVHTSHGERPLTDEDRRAIRRTIHRYDRDVMRPIAFACRRLPPEIAHTVPHTEDIAHQLVFLGLMAVTDPPRQEVQDAIRACHRAGIRTMMLTGDYALSAESLARRCSLVETSRATVITGIELSELSDADLRARLRVGDIVFARMTPEHKVRVVETLASMGEVVLVTGGAANDVPAIKAADIGVAMGTSSSDAARVAADVVLEQDNFATIALAILKGRAVEQRARRLAVMNLGGTGLKLAALGIALLFGWPLLLTIGQMLLIDLLAGLLPAVSLSAHRADDALMNRPPRRSGRSLIDRRIYVLGYGWFALLSVVFAAGGAWLAKQISEGGSGTMPPLAPLLSGNGDVASLQAATAYVVLGIAAIVGAGLRLRSSMLIRGVGGGLVLLVVGLIAVLLVLAATFEAVHPIVALSMPQAWLWIGGVAVLIAAAAMEWGRQKLDPLPQGKPVEMRGAGSAKRTTSA